MKQIEGAIWCALFCIYRGCFTLRKGETASGLWICLVIWKSIYSIAFISTVIPYGSNVTVNHSMSSTGSNVSNMFYLWHYWGNLLRITFLIFSSLVLSLPLVRRLPTHTHTHSCDDFIKEISRSLTHFEEVTFSTGIMGGGAGEIMSDVRHSVIRNRTKNKHISHSNTMAGLWCSSMFATIQQQCDVGCLQRVISVHSSWVHLTHAINILIKKPPVQLCGN